MKTSALRRMAALCLLLLMLPWQAYAADIELTIVHIQDSPLAQQAINDSVARFEADHPGVSVRLTMLMNDIYKRRISVSASADSLPDVFLTWGGAMLSEYVSIGRVNDLTGSLHADGYVDRFLPTAISQVQFDGGIWGVPVENISAGVVFYNRALFDRLGLSVPETYDELLAVIRTLKDNDIIPFALANRSGWPGSMYYMYLVDRLGGTEAFGRALRREGDGFADPVFLEAWTLYAELVEMGAFPADANTLEEDTGDSRQLLYEEEAAMLLMGSWMISNVMSENPEFLENLDFFPFPSLQQDTPEKRLIGTVGDNFYSVSSSCEHPELAFSLITYLIDDVAVDLRLAAGKIPPVRLDAAQAASLFPLTGRLLPLIEEAEHIQLWYDQALPPKLAETHKQLCRDVFSGVDAQTLAERMVQAEKEYYETPAP